MKILERLEGGDIVWIDTKTLAIGEGYRSNSHGIKQLKAILGDLVEELSQSHFHTGMVKMTAFIS